MKRRSRLLAAALVATTMGWNTPAWAQNAVHDNCTGAPHRNLAVGQTAFIINDNTGATEDLPGLTLVWESFTLTSSCADVTIDYCVPGSVFSNFLNNITTTCPEPWDGLLLADDGDPNCTAIFRNLTPRTYYIPVMVTPGNPQGLYTISVSATACAAPANDNCGDAQVLTVNSAGGCPAGGTPGNNIGASNDGGAVPCIGSGTVVDVWYKFNSGSNTAVSCSFSNATFSSLAVQVFQGSCSGTSVHCAVGSAAAENLFATTPNTDYWIRVGSEPGTGGDFTICLNAATLTAPANDNCANAQVVTLNASGGCPGGAIQGSNQYATDEGITAACLGPGPFHDVWYRFNTGAFNKVSYSFPTFSFTSLLLEVRVGGCNGSSMHCAGGNDAMNNSFTAMPNTDYWVRVAANTGTGGDFTVCFSGETTGGPANDDCANAQVLAVNSAGGCPAGGTAGNNATATNDGGAMACGGAGGPYGDVWYKFNSGSNTGVTCSLTNVTLSTLIVEVRQGSCSGSTVHCATGNSALDNLFATTPNTDYWIRVSSDLGSGGGFNICLSAASVSLPANDNCSNAQVLTLNNEGSCPASGTQGTNQFATDDGISSTCMGPGPFQDVWYRFNSGSYATVAYDFSAVSFSSLLVEVREGSCSGDWVFCRGGNDALANSFETELFTDYWFRVASNPNTGGAFTICLNGVNSPFEPCNNIVNIPACDTPTGPQSVAAGTGEWSETELGGSDETPGKERIFTFTPATSGTYQIEVTQYTGGNFIDFFWKEAGICDGTGWNYLGWKNSPGVVNVDSYYATGVALNLTAGVTYYIMWDTENTTGRTVDFTVQCMPPPPANDDCANAQLLTVNNSGGCPAGATPGTNEYATADGSSNTCFGGNLPDVWYRFNSGAFTSVSYSFTADTFGSLGVGVFEGSCSGSEVFCSVGAAALANSFMTTPNTDYWIRVASNTDSGGSFNICLTGATGSYDPCANIVNIPACNTPTGPQSVDDGFGAWGLAELAGSDETPGKERIFTFTPATSGTYQIQVDQYTGGNYIDFFWKEAGTCDATGWNYLGWKGGTGIVNVDTQLGNGQALNLTAGVTYYIMWDTENTAGRTVDFTILCAPVNPCDNIVNIGGCEMGTGPQAAGAGTGTWDSGLGGAYPTPGKERIFTFTPTHSGKHAINILSISAPDYIDFFWKEAGTCDGNSWNWQGWKSATGTTIEENEMILNAGTTYYIMWDPEFTTGVTVDFEILCPDCDGEPGGTAYTDNCGQCVGGNTGNTACVQDCNGDWGGTAYTDNCGQCVGGNTGNTACVQDCNGDWGGTAYTDNCSQCVGGNTGNTTCVQDCNGDWGGTAYTDNCSQCVGGNTGNTACVQDCNGDWGGTAYTDNCSQCVGGNTGNTACMQDCNGDWGGTAYTDNCSQCVGGNTGNTACAVDCNGDFGGTAYTDNCGQCVGGNTGNTACVQDCNGDWGGTAYTDNCSQCVGGNTGNTACVQDCNGDWGGTAYTDNCSQCVGGNTGNTACVQDCNGDWGGTAYTDNCSQCVGGNTGATACVQDCHGDWGGTAYVDGCNDCVGGNTGQTACAVDCNGDFGGTAYTDNCGQCVGGNTGNTACVQDCNGDWGGTALPGTTCDDGDPNTENDLWDANCECHGTPVGGPCIGHQVVVTITGGNAGNITWEFVDAGNNVVATGSGGGNTTACLGTGTGAGWYGFRLEDGSANGLANGGWELRTLDGKLIMRDAFDVASGSSPMVPGHTPSYGAYHTFALPIGPVDIHTDECEVWDNQADNKIYAVKQGGKNYQGATLNYQFEFINPDSGRVRRTKKPRNYVLWSELTNPDLVANVKYYARVRTDKSGPLANAHWGAGCEMSMGAPTACTGLIDDPNNQYYSCGVGVERRFRPNSQIFAWPVYGASKYKFRIYNLGEGYDQEFISNNYKLELSWPANVAPKLRNGYTYQVQVSALVNGVWTAYCASCTITINNYPSGHLVEVFGEATLWPNPARTGQVNLNIDGITSDVQHITVDVKDIYGQHVYGQEFENGGERFTTVLELPGNIATGIYLVNITVNGEVITKRLSIMR